ncbi:MAG TPA: hypothetical protein VGR71_09145, partial [Nitrospira sp.]|nr:hypothetical protein [Nitrospira sp.]
AAVSTSTLGINPISMPPEPEQPSGIPVTTKIDDRLLDAEFRDGSFLLSATSGCVPSGDTALHDCIRVIQVLTGSQTVNQDFDFGTVGGDYFYPAITLDSSDNLITTFSASSPSEFPSVYASGRLAGDPLNTLQVPVQIKAGEASYSADGFSEPRWGDYSATVIDPNDQTKVWGAGEYATSAAGGGNWGTFIAELQSPAPGPDTTPPTISITSSTDGSTYGINQQVTASYSCTDPDDAVATCAGAVPSGSTIDTSSGSHTFTVNASDSHGNTSSASVTYTVPQPIGPLTFSKSSLNFNAKKVGTTSLPKTITVKNPKTNSGTANISITIDSPEFSEFDTCGGGIAVGKNCKIKVRFGPNSVGIQSGTVVVNGNFSNGPETVGVSGSGK